MSIQARPMVAATAIGVTTMPRMARVILLPIVGILGYVAFLITGFGTGLSPAQQPLVLYVYLSLMLIVFQIVILKNPAPATLIYVFLTSGFAILYAADFSFFRRNNIFVGHGVTYIIINTLLFLVFLYDAFNRRRARPQPLDPSASDEEPAGPLPVSRQPRLAPFSFGAFAVDFASLAVISYVAWLLLNAVASLLSFQVDISGLRLPGIATLNDLDRDIAVGATGVALALVVLASLLAVTAGDDTVAVEQFGRLNVRIVGDALNDALLSLRLVLGPLLWLLPAFSIANFSRNTVDFLNASAHAPGNPYLNLFNPFSANSLAHARDGVQSIVLFGVAVVAVILAVAVIEHNTTIFGRALRIAGIAGRALALLSALFFISLAVINAFLILIRAVDVTPFQLGAPILIALAAFVSFLAYSSVRTRFAAGSNR